MSEELLRPGTLVALVRALCCKWHSGWSTAQALCVLIIDLNAPNGKSWNQS